MTSQTDQFLIPPHRTCITPSTPVRSSVKLGLVGVNSYKNTEEDRRNFLPDLKPPIAPKLELPVPERAATIATLPQVVLSNPQQKSFSSSLADKQQQAPVTHIIESEIYVSGKFRKKPSKAQIASKDSARNLLNSPVNISNPSVHENVESPFSPNFLDRQNSPQKEQDKTIQEKEPEISTTDILSLSESTYDSKPLVKEENLENTKKNEKNTISPEVVKRITENSKLQEQSIQSSTDQSITETQNPEIKVELISKKSPRGAPTQEKVQLTLDISQGGKLKSQRKEKSPRNNYLHSEFRVKIPKRRGSRPTAVENETEFVSPRSPPTSPKVTNTQIHSEKPKNNLDSMKGKPTPLLENPTGSPPNEIHFYQKFSSFVVSDIHQASPSEFETKHAKKSMSKIRDTFQKSDSTSDIDIKSIPPNSEDLKAQKIPGVKNLQISNSVRSKKIRENIKMANEHMEGKSKAKKPSRDLFFSAGSREDKSEFKEIRSVTPNSQKRGRKTKGANEKEMQFSSLLETAESDDFFAAFKKERKKKKGGSAIQSKSSDFFSSSTSFEKPRLIGSPVIERKPKEKFLRLPFNIKKGRSLDADQFNRVDQKKSPEISKLTSSGRRNTEISLNYQPQQIHSFQSLPDTNQTPRPLEIKRGSDPIISDSLYNPVDYFDEPIEFDPTLNPPIDGVPRRIPKIELLSTKEKVNRRLSKNLTGSAIILSDRLEGRVSYEYLKTQKILLDPPKFAPYVPPTWTSKIRIQEEWLDPGDYSWKLISQECIKKGYHIELPRRKAGNQELRVFDTDKDILFFRQLVNSGAKISNFIGEDNGNIYIISTEMEKSKKFQRVIVRTAQEDHRLIITAATRSQILRQIVNQCPFLANVKLTEVSKNEQENFTNKLLEFENKMIVLKYKFGIFYAKDGQTTEDEWLNNVNGSPAFEKFIDLIGDRIDLLGWKDFRGGLDVRTGTTGLQSIYCKYNRLYEIMFHVSTLIPYTPGDKQQVERKRHLGNDIVVIIFKEGNSLFDPLLIRSQFNHVFVVVEADVLDSGETFYKVEWVCKPGVPPFQPYEQMPSEYLHSTEFRDYFVTKLLNAERSAMLAKEFKNKMSRTRAMLLKEFVEKPKK